MVEIVLQDMLAEKQKIQEQRYYERSYVPEKVLHSASPFCGIFTIPRLFQGAVEKNFYSWYIITKIIINSNGPYRRRLAKNAGERVIYSAVIGLVVGVLAALIRGLTERGGNMEKLWRLLPFFGLGLVVGVLSKYMESLLEIIVLAIGLGLLIGPLQARK